MKRFSKGDTVITNNGSIGRIRELLEAVENPSDQLYEIHFGWAGNMRIRHSEIKYASIGTLDQAANAESEAG